MNSTLSVSQLTDRIKYTLEEGFSSISVSGEISNFKHHSSGHRYFTLKDSGAQISCTMWRSRTLNFRPTDGMKVIIRGRITVYPPRGNYQIDCISMLPQGQGDLFMAFEALKEKLENDGFFDRERKRPLPRFPLNIGVATSPTGAAVRDIFSTLERRFPAANIYFRPVIVQGDEAAPDIVRAINELNRQNIDLIIIGRGGGSLEDLWAFNTEEVANAIFNSEKPVISAVGHETDFTISDFVADIRAATPTAAAELASPFTTSDLLKGLETIQEKMKNSASLRIEDVKEKLDEINSPAISRRLEDKINIPSQRIDDLHSMLNRNISLTLEKKRNKLENLDSLCRNLYPLRPLENGFAILKSSNIIIGKNQSLADYKNVDIYRQNETAHVEVKKISKNKV